VQFRQNDDHPLELIPMSMAGNDHRIAAASLLATMFFLAGGAVLRGWAVNAERHP
jgi:hypothetical protein